MKITYILITAIGSVITAPIENTKGTAYNIKDIDGLDCEKRDIWDGRRRSSFEEPLVTPFKDVVTRSADSQTMKIDAGQIASDLSFDNLKMTTTTSMTSQGLDKIGYKLLQEINTKEAGVEKPIGKSNACENSREKRNVIWLDTEHAVSHYKVSEDYPEPHQGNCHVVSKDYPVPNLVRVTLREQF